MTDPSRPMLTVAHRAGNTVAGLREALAAGVDLVEADVHAYRGVLEVRHHKRLGPAHLWDHGEVVARARFPSLDLPDLLDAVGADPRLMLDLKGLSRQLPRAVADALGARTPGHQVTVCTQHWWMLDSFDPGVRRVLSAGSARGLRRLRHRVATAPVFGACVRLDLLTAAVVAELASRVEVVMTWPVDTPEALERAQEIGVGGVISKDLELLRRARS